MTNPNFNPRVTGISSVISSVAYRAARYRGLRHHDAEDISQGTVVAVLGRAVPPLEPVAFGRQVAVNLRNLLLRRRAHPVGAAVSLDPSAHDAPAREELDALPTLDVRELIRQAEPELGVVAVAALAFVLAGYTQLQIAAALGLSRRAHQQVYYRALSVLRKYAQRQIDESEQAAGHPSRPRIQIVEAPAAARTR